MKLKLHRLDAISLICSLPVVIDGQESAESYIHLLKANGLLHHPDDCPMAVLGCTPDQAAVFNQRMEACIKVSGNLDEGFDPYSASVILNQHSADTRWRLLANFHYKQQR